jgi:hypothetical protein
MVGTICQLGNVVTETRREKSLVTPILIIDLDNLIPNESRILNLISVPIAVKMVRLQKLQNECISH